VSRFRASAGHDYSDDVEKCRSMKHYFRPRAGTDWGTVRVFAPVERARRARVRRVGGVQLHVRSSARPAFTVVLFHVAPRARSPRATR
jgi:hypothetical protein